MLRSLLIAAALSVCLPVPVVAQDAAGCVVLSADGRAYIFAPGASRLIAEAGLALTPDATLRTEKDARVVLQCPDDLTVVVGPQTEITTAQLMPADRQPVALRLIRGIVGFLYGGDGDGVQVHTPSAVAAVRSTEWSMRVIDGASAVFAREGTVVVVGGDATVHLTPGEGVDVGADGAVKPVVRWGQARVDLFAGLLGPAW